MDDVDIRQYWNTIWRRKLLVLTIAAIATGIAALLILPAPFIYRATTTVMIESKEANVVSIQDVYGVDSRGQEYYQTQYEILKSRPIAEKVVDRLALARRPEFEVHAADPEIAHNTLLDRYLDTVRISPVPRSQLVKVSVDSHDPKLAAAMANAHAQAFIETYLDAKELAARSALQWLGARLEELRVKLNSAETKLQEFKEREHIIDVDGFQTTPAHQLNEMTTRLMDARRELSQTGNAYAQIAQARSAQLDEKLAIPAIRADRLVQQFGQERAEADRQLNEISKRYGPLHPQMQAAISARATAEEALEKQVDSVMNAIKNEHEILRGQERSIAEEVSKTATDVQLIGRKGAEYRALAREVDTSQQLFNLFYKRFSETKETDSLDSANARIVEPAIAPLAPVAPKKELLITLTFVLSLLAGLILAFLLEYLDNTIKHAADVERRVGSPLLGTIPRVRRPRGERENAAGSAVLARDKNLEFGEAIRALRTSITLSSLEKSAKTLLITSSIANEGKTALACNLAVAFSKLERVLLIDGDLRKASVARELNISVEHGLANICEGTADLTTCIVRCGSIDVLAAGTSSANPQELLSQSALRSLLEALRQRYDRIIIDSPPVLPVKDALLLANEVDAIIYVIKVETTTVRCVTSGIQTLKHAPARLAGVVLNQVDMKKLAAYGDYSGSYYA